MVCGKRRARALSYRQLIVDLAARFRVPAIYPYREFVEVGGLMAYGVDIGGHVCVVLRT